MGKELRIHSHSLCLHRDIMKSFFKIAKFLQPMIFASHTVRAAQAVALGYLIDFFEGANNQCYLWASIIVLCAIVILFALQYYFLYAWGIGMTFRLVCITAIYDQLSRLL